jgi:hypothetical protein
MKLERAKPRANYARIVEKRDGKDFWYWGIFVQFGLPKELPKPGDKITVTRRDGSQQVETVKEVIWIGQGEDVCHCSIEPRDKLPTRPDPFMAAWKDEDL